jgi:hypothetical protein
MFHYIFIQSIRELIILIHKNLDFLCRVCVVSVPSLCRLCVVSVSSLCRLCVVFVSSLYRLCVVSVSSLYRHCVVFVSSLCRILENVYSRTYTRERCLENVVSRKLSSCRLNVVSRMLSYLCVKWIHILIKCELYIDCI